MIELPLWLVFVVLVVMGALLIRVFALNAQVEIYRELAAMAEAEKQDMAERIGRTYSEALRNSIKVKFSGN